MKQTILQTALLLTAFHINAEIEGKFVISHQKIEKLKHEIVGKNKKIMKESTVKGKTRNIEQSYFSGLVYRYDNREFSEIATQNGFKPKIPRGINNPLFLYEINNPENQTSVEFIADDSSVVTVKKYDTKPVNRWDDKSCYIYMIDPTVCDLWGLDIDATNNTTNNKTYEVDFDFAIPLNCIIGYFTKDKPKTFYKSALYHGHFSWRKGENKFIKNYIKHSFKKSPNRKQRCFNFLMRLSYL